MIDKIVVIFIISGLVGFKKPIYGGLAGLIVAPAIHYFFFIFNPLIFIASFPLGFGAGWLSGTLVSWFFSGFRGGNHNTGPHFRPMPGRSGGGQRGGIVFTDEEQKNVRENERNIR